MPYAYDLVSVEVDGGVAFCTIDNQGSSDRS